MIESPVIYLRSAGWAVRFNTQPALVNRLVVAVRAEFRLMAAIAVLGVIRCLYGVS